MKFFKGAVNKRRLLCSYIFITKPAIAKGKPDFLSLLFTSQEKRIISIPNNYFPFFLSISTAPMMITPLMICW